MHSGAFLRRDVLTARAFRLGEKWTLSPDADGVLAVRCDGVLVDAMHPPSGAAGAPVPSSLKRAVDRSFVLRDGADVVVQDAGDLVSLPAPGRVDSDSPPCELSVYEGGVSHPFALLRLAFEARAENGSPGSRVEVVVRRGDGWEPIPGASVALQAPLGSFALYHTAWVPLTGVTTFALRVSAGRVTVGRVGADLAF